MGQTLRRTLNLLNSFFFLNLTFVTSYLRAAFENVSRMTVQPHDQSSPIDLRNASIPAGLESPSADAYDPREHRYPKNPIKVWMAYLNLIRAGFGAGVLGFPLAISQSGIVLGPILAVFTGVLITHTHWILLRCLNEISRQLKIPYISYRYGFRIALLHGPPIIHCIGRHGPFIIATFMILSQLGICTVFVDFTADSLRDILDLNSSRSALIILLVPYLLLEFCMKNLKIVSYISMFGNVMNCAGLILIFYHIFITPGEEVIFACTEALPLAFAFGIILFNLSAVGVILSLDKALENSYLMVKKCGILTIGMGVPIGIATVFGTLGYWAFGTMEENVLRYLPYEDNTAMIAIGLYMVAVTFAFPIQSYPAIQIIREIIQNYSPYTEPSNATLKQVEIMLRPLFVLTTFLIAYIVPFQGPFVAFVGNLCTTMLALVFPALMELCIMYPGPFGKFNIYLIKNIFIIVLGVVSWIVGAILCGNLIYVRIIASASPNNPDYF